METAPIPCYQRIDPSAEGDKPQLEEEDLLRRAPSTPTSPPEERWELWLTILTIMVKFLSTTKRTHQQL